MKLANIAKLATAGIGLSTLAINNSVFAEGAADGSAKGVAATSFFNGTTSVNTTKIAGTTNDLTVVIQNMMNWVTGFIFLIATIYGIYGGYLYLTAGGEEDQTKKAKTIFKQVAIGILIIFMAYSIVSFFM